MESDMFYGGYRVHPPGGLDTDGRYKSTRDSEEKSERVTFGATV